MLKTKKQLNKVQRLKNIKTGQNRGILSKRNRNKKLGLGFLGLSTRMHI